MRHKRGHEHAHQQLGARRYHLRGQVWVVAHKLKALLQPDIIVKESDATSSRITHSIARQIHAARTIQSFYLMKASYIAGIKQQDSYNSSMQHSEQ